MNFLQKTLAVTAGLTAVGLIATAVYHSKEQASVANYDLIAHRNVKLHISGIATKAEIQIQVTGDEVIITFEDIALFDTLSEEEQEIFNKLKKDMVDKFITAILETPPFFRKQRIFQFSYKTSITMKDETFYSINLG